MVLDVTIIPMKIGVQMGRMDQIGVIADSSCIIKMTGSLHSIVLNVAVKVIKLTFGLCSKDN